MVLPEFIIEFKGKTLNYLQTNTCSKLTIETLEKSVKYVQT